jgi:uncharacterized protein YqeY
MIKEQINREYIVALKAKDTYTKNILSVVKGEIQTVEKNLVEENLSDSNVIKILLKIQKSLKETLSKVNDEESKFQLEVIENYLPKQISDEDILTHIERLMKEGVNDIGGIMRGFININADKKRVSELFKRIN